MSFAFWPIKKASLDPLNLDQWTFWVLPSALLNEKAAAQKTLSLSSLMKLQPVQATYETLSAAIEQVAPRAQAATQHFIAAHAGSPTCSS